jgi:hypothetical protein
MVHTLVTFHVLPGRTEEFESLHRRLLELICAQPGCREVRVHRAVVELLEYVVLNSNRCSSAYPSRAHAVADTFFRDRVSVRRDRCQRTSVLNERPSSISLWCTRRRATRRYWFGSPDKIRRLRCVASSRQQNGRRFETDSLADAARNSQRI